MQRQSLKFMANSDSSNISRLRDFLAGRGVDFLSEVKANRTPPIDFALFVAGDRVAERAGKGQISHRQMKLLQRDVKKHLGLEVEWIVTAGQQTTAMEVALHELLEARYPGAASAVYISSPKIVPVSVWIEPSPKAKNRPEMAHLKTVCAQFLKLFGIEGSVVMYGESEDLPSNPMILRNLKINAPVTTERLADQLRSMRSIIPNVRWLQGKLDTLRKEGLVTRSNEGDYSLTELGLGIVPYGKHRSSSDIERALALGRRRW
jgi:hypothetical protein